MRKFKEFIKSCILWLKESNRYKHLIGGFIVGLLLSILCVIGVAGGMEFKDREYSNNWDWIDFSITCLGGIIGNLMWVFIWLICK